MSILLSAHECASCTLQNGHTYFCNTTSVPQCATRATMWHWSRAAIMWHWSRALTLYCKSTYVHFAEWGLQIIAIAQEWTYVLLQYNVSATMCHQCHNVALVESTDVVLQKYVCPFCRVGLANYRDSTGMDIRTLEYKDSCGTGREH